MRLGILVVGFTKAMLPELIEDKTVYVIKKHWAGEGYDMVPIAKATEEDLLSDNIAIIRIT